MIFGDYSRVEEDACPIRVNETKRKQREGKRHGLIVWGVRSALRLIKLMYLSMV